MPGIAQTPKYKKRREVWREILHDTEESKGLAAKRLALMESWEDDPWAYFTALDIPTEEHPQGRPIIWTVDELDEVKAVKPFPGHKAYLREITEEMWKYRIVLFDKIRQKYITTLCSLNIDWYCSISRFRDEREVFVSRTKEELAEKILADKILRVHQHKPKWLQQACPLEATKTVLKFTHSNSQITAVSQNFADARGATASLVLVDEAAFQELYPSIFRAILPMSGRIWAPSTANVGNPGADLFAAQVHEGKPGSVEETESADPKLQAALSAQRQHRVYRTGLEAFTTPKGYRVLVLRLGADPEDTPEWIARVHQGYTNEKDWRREMMGDWSSPAGDPYFPIFSQTGRERYVHLVRRMITGPVYRSFDFGRRRPACTWFQYAPKSDRLWGYREFMPHDLLTHEFRDAVRYLSGQLDWDLVPERAQWWIQSYKERASGRHCPPPWFPPNTNFVDIGGKEALQASANAQRPEEATAKDIFGLGGMHLVIVNPDVKGRNDIVGRMLMQGSDGWPRTFLDPQMEETIQGFDGAFSYPVKTRAIGLPEKPRNDNHYINLLDAWGYGVVAVVPQDTPEAPRPQVVVGYESDYRTPIYGSPDVEEIGWRETRRGRQ